MCIVYPPLSSVGITPEFRLLINKKLMFTAISSTIGVNVEQEENR
jgi:hypothetical protein